MSGLKACCCTMVRHRYWFPCASTFALGNFQNPLKSWLPSVTGYSTLLIYEDHALESLCITRHSDWLHWFRKLFDINATLQRIDRKQKCESLTQHTLSMRSMNCTFNIVMLAQYSTYILGCIRVCIYTVHSSSLICLFYRFYPYLLLVLHDMHAPAVIDPCPPSVIHGDHMSGAGSMIRRCRKTKKIGNMSLKKSQKVAGAEQNMWL